MQLNADFSKAVTAHPDSFEWINSPQAGVERVMLDRVGGEKARATSLVRYACDSFFPPHQHPGGEEIFVLEGVFSEAGHDFPSAWYMRNPPGTSHQPYSKPGALIFVKLCQMLPDNRVTTRIDTNDPTSWRVEHGRNTCWLYQDEYEQVYLQQLGASDGLLSEAQVDQLSSNQPQGAEVLVLNGSLDFERNDYPKFSWLRLPQAELSKVSAGREGALVYIKHGVLGLTSPCIELS